MWVGARERQRHRETDMEEEQERDGHRRDTGEREIEPNRKAHRKSQIHRDPKESQTKAPGRSPQGSEVCSESGQSLSGAAAVRGTAWRGPAGHGGEGRGLVGCVSAGREGRGRGLPAGSFPGKEGGQGDFGVAARVRLEVGPQAWGGAWVNLFSLGPGLGLGLGGVGLCWPHLPSLPVPFWRMSVSYPATCLVLFQVGVVPLAG